MTSSNDATAGDKHKLDDAGESRPAKTQKVDDKGDDKVQTTLDDAVTRQKASTADDNTDKDKQDDDKPSGSQSKNNTSEDNTDKQDDDQPSDAQSKNDNNQDDTAVEPHGRQASTPSNMLEKGIIYFFFRGRVGIDHPEQVSDIARTFMLLRPVPTDAKLGDGPIGDAGNSRLIAIPKKKLPKTGRDRWIAFVEKTDASFDELRKDFLPANDYETKTAGVRHSPPATPIAQGVYALTTTGRESHLAYMLTLPQELGDVQTTIGLKEKGSWILSTRNPQYPAPSNTALPQGPDYSKEILDEFRSLRWMGTLPKHLVLNAQFLLVGESSGIEKAMEPDEDDKDSKEKEDPIEEMEELEHEDVKRMKHLGKTDSEAIFLDLEAYAKDRPQLQTEF
ncbi:hypothetical protein J7T55_012479 [Diaporthe amygdali]|uniref:uncharacterized protein n=1 Tax=Phomopsis amygdali TaxID=1214568 RepID=UPI0022FE829C|nr:uncharacterized protein J7T55_012479 [Diaporthe amygdali]KAJ0124006.1 hypothetical protein J7T55_012479 [Diaporthe amygdali]